MSAIVPRLCACKVVHVLTMLGDTVVLVRMDGRDTVVRRVWYTIHNHILKYEDTWLIYFV